MQAIPRMILKKGDIAMKAAAMLLVLLVIFADPAKASSSKPFCHRIVPKPNVCLTVDDGFNAKYIKSVLMTLKQNHVQCTFFVIGKCLLKADCQPLWRQAVLEGHEICYHTMRHQRVSGFTKRQINADITAWEKAAHMVLGESYRIPKFARLPGGAGSFDQRILKIYASRGYTLFRWNVDILTGAVNRGISEKSYIKRKVKQGAVILIHFNRRDASALPGYIGWLKQNFRLNRISDALSQQTKPTPCPTATTATAATPAETPPAVPTDSPTTDPTSPIS